jgi:hypothetical protein
MRSRSSRWSWLTGSWASAGNAARTRGSQEEEPAGHFPLRFKVGPSCVPWQSTHSMSSGRYRTTAGTSSALRAGGRRRRGRPGARRPGEARIELVIEVEDLEAARGLVAALAGRLPAHRELPVVGVRVAGAAALAGRRSQVRPAVPGAPEGLRMGVWQAEQACLPCSPPVRSRSSAGDPSRHERAERRRRVAARAARAAVDLPRQAGLFELALVRVDVARDAARDAPVDVDDAPERAPEGVRRGRARVAGLAVGLRVRAVDREVGVAACGRTRPCRRRRRTRCRGRRRRSRAAPRRARRLPGEEAAVRVPVAAVAVRGVPRKTRAPSFGRHDVALLALELVVLAVQRSSVRCAARGRSCGGGSARARGRRGSRRCENGPVANCPPWGSAWQALQVSGPRPG